MLREVASRLVDLEGMEVSLLVRGHGFTATSTVFWKEQALATTVLSDTELSAVLPTEEPVSWLERQLSVRNTGPSGVTSSELTYLPYPVPELHSVSPEALPSEPTGPVRLILTGRNFVRGSHVDCQGILYPATVLSMERAEVELPASALSDGTTSDLLLKVEVPRPRPTVSNPRTLRVGSPDVELQGVVPSSLSTRGRREFVVLSVKNSRSVTQVKWNGRPVEFRRYVNQPDLYLPLPPDARSKPGLATLTLETAGSDGGVPAPFLLPIVDAPVVHRLVPQWLQVGSEFNWLTLHGEGWGPDVDLYWDDRVIEPQPSTQDDAAYVLVPASEMARPGTHGVRVHRKSDGVMSQPVFVEVVDAAPAPLAFGLEPAVVSAGDMPLRLWVHGRNFRPTSIIRVDGKDRVSQLHGTSTLITLLEASDLAEAGIRTVTVHTPGPGGGTSQPLLLKVDARRPVPQLAGLSAPFASAGSSAMTLHLSGSGLGPYSVVRWNSTLLNTRWEPDCCGGESRLAAQVPAELLAQPTVARLTVLTPGPGGGLSNAIDFAVLAPGESAPELFPRSVEVGSPGVTVLVRGSGFNPATFVMVGDAPRTTTFTDSTSVLVRLEAQELVSERTLELRTVTPRPEGSVASAPQFLRVRPPRTPVLRSLVPAVVATGQWARGEVGSIGIRGDHFARTDVVTQESPPLVTLDWGDTGLPVLFHYNTWWWEEGPVAYLPGDAVASPGTVEVRASRAHEDGGTSLSALVHIVAERPVPHVSGVSSPTLRVGAASHVLDLEGQGFHSATVVRWNGQALTTRTVNERLLRAVVPGALVAVQGTARLTVETPAPGGGVSLPVPVRVE